MYQRILLAVDGSHASYLALHQAIEVSKATGAEVEALFVADCSDVTFDMVGTDSIAYATQVVEYGRDTLAEVGKRLDAAGVKYSIKLLENHCARADLGHDCRGGQRDGNRPDCARHAWSTRPQAPGARQRGRRRGAQDQ